MKSTMDSRKAYYAFTFLCVIIGTCEGELINVTMSCDIETIGTITEAVIQTVHFNYSIKDLQLPTDNLLSVCASVRDTDIAKLHSWDGKAFDLREQPFNTFNISIHGLFVGRTYMQLKFVFSRAELDLNHTCQSKVDEKIDYHLSNEFNLTYVPPADTDNLTSFEGQYEVVVIRQHRPIDTTFNVVVILLVMVVNLGLGCKMELDVVKETLRRPVAPVIGLCSQFIIMPSISFAAVKVFQFEPALALGFFALGCSPGGSASNAYTLLLNGDVSLSITMTFISTLVALGMIPLWLLTLGRLLYANTSIRIPYQNIFYSLLGLVVPVCVGLVVKWKRPRWARILVKVSKVMMVVFLIFVLTVGVYANIYIFRLMTLRVLATAALLPYLGFFLGGLVAFVFRMPRNRVLTIAIETGIQNTGIAIVLLLLSLKHPESDISIVAPITSAIFTPIPLWVAIAFVHIRKRWCETRKPEMNGYLDDGEEIEGNKEESKVLNCESDTKENAGNAFLMD